MDDTKLRLINAAGPIFARKGFEAASVREICQQAGANIAAVNYHFSDKQRLYVACLEHAQCSHDRESIPAEWPPGYPPRQMLHDFIHGMLADKLRDDRPRWHLELMMREMIEPTEACGEVVESFIRPMATRLRQILMQLSDIEHNFDDWSNRGWMLGFSIVAQVLFYYMNQPIIRHLIGPDRFAELNVDELADHMTHFCLAAMGQAPALTAANKHWQDPAEAAVVQRLIAEHGRPASAPCGDATESHHAHRAEGGRVDDQVHEMTDDSNDGRRETSVVQPSSGASP